MTIHTLPQAFELAKSHGSDSNGFFVLLSLANIHSPYLSNSDKVAELENLLFFAHRCIGAGCEPCFPLPGQDDQGSSPAASVEVGQVETPTQKAKPSRAALGKRSAEAARAGFAIVFGVQGCTASPVFSVPAGNTGTDLQGVLFHA